MVQFTDIDRDGMTDLVFYDSKKISVFYNKHTAPHFTSSFDQELLCKESEATSYLPVFDDFYRLPFIDE